MGSFCNIYTRKKIMKCISQNENKSNIGSEVKISGFVNSAQDFTEHPKYIIDKLENLNPEQFGYNAFGLKEKYFGESS